MSNNLKMLPEKFKDKAEIVSGPLTEILKHINNKGYTKLYIDGASVVQNFLKEDLIDEIIITTIPVFGELPIPLEFEHVDSDLFMDEIVQDSYKRKR